MHLPNPPGNELSLVPWGIFDQSVLLKSSSFFPSLDPQSAFPASEQTYQVESQDQARKHD